MASWTPQDWGIFLTVLSTFVVTLGGVITNILISLRNGRKADVTADKLETNNQLTADIHKVTNGPLSNMEETVKGIVTQAATNAAIAHSVAEAAKTQAAIDAKTTPLAKPLEKTP